MGSLGATPGSVCSLLVVRTQFFEQNFRVQMLGDLAKCSLNCELKGLAVHLGDDVLNKGCQNVGAVNFCRAPTFLRLPVSATAVPFCHSTFVFVCGGIADRPVSEPVGGTRKVVCPETVEV